jgi:lysylphosphatidylglycerol synthetase-like protein (DUF2156 family)
VATRDDENDDEDRVIYHPNQEKASSKATKAIVVLLLIVSAVLTLLITIGGWSNLQGAKIISIFFILVFFVMAYFVARWYRGVLPLAAGLSVILGVFAAIAAFGTGSWFDRSNNGYNHSGLPPDLIGLLCVVLIPVLILLIAFSLRAFAQKWNIEIEMSRDEFEHKQRDGGRGGGSYGDARPAQA